MIFLTLYLLFTNKCFYKCIVDIHLLDVIRNKQKTWRMNIFFTHCRCVSCLRWYSYAWRWLSSGLLIFVRLKMAVFWVVAPCSLVATSLLTFQRRLLPPSPPIALMMEAASTSETSVNFYQTTRRYNPEDSHLHNRRRENLKSYLFVRLITP
jgi:hypothetical protein